MSVNENQDASIHRRHSSRSIKRRKFDDELVESSLSLKPQLRKSFDGAEEMDTAQHIETPPPSEEIPIIERKVYHKQLQDVAKKPSSSAGSVSGDKKVIKKKKMKKTRQAFAAAKDMGRWKPTDDIMLIDAVMQVQDLAQVHLGVKFSCYFTLEEIQERWYALLYDPVISGLAKQAMKVLPPELAREAHAKALYSKSEEQILAKILTNTQPTIESFQAALDKNVSVFHHSRTAEGLKKHWEMMKKYHLVEDQVVQPLPQGDHILNFSDAEDMLDDQEILQQRDDAISHELKIADRKQKLEIKKLEEEIPRWELLVSSVTGFPKQEMDQHTIAVLRGRLVRYLMRSREITFGRSTEYLTVDIDLSLEGPAYKISRQQGTIKMKNNGEFVVTNEGKRPIYVDGKVVLKGGRARLQNDSVLEIALLRFVFLVNDQLVNSSK